MTEKPNEITLLYQGAIKDYPEGPMTKAFVKKTIELARETFGKLTGSVIVTKSTAEDIEKTLEMAENWTNGAFVLSELDKFKNHLWAELIDIRTRRVTDFVSGDLECRQFVYDILTNLTDACLELTPEYIAKYKMHREEPFTKLIEIINCQRKKLLFWAKSYDLLANSATTAQ